MVGFLQSFDLDSTEIDSTAGANGIADQSSKWALNMWRQKVTLPIRITCLNDGCGSPPNPPEPYAVVGCISHSGLQRRGCVGRGHYCCSKQCGVAALGIWQWFQNYGLFC